MQKLKLSPRLAEIAALVPQNANLADVGTDHAYLPVWLLLQGRISHAIASDINEGPLACGRETAVQYGVGDLISFRRCDGLASISPQEVNTVVVAGMGGDLICHILAEAPWTKQVKLILQPMSSQEILRKWLTENGYLIQNETIACEGNKLYTILDVTGGISAPYSAGELWAGKHHADDINPYRLLFLTDLINRRKKALNGIIHSRVPDSQRLAQEQMLLEELNQMKEEWMQWQR